MLYHLLAEAVLLRRKRAELFPLIQDFKYKAIYRFFSTLFSDFLQYFAAGNSGADGIIIRNSGLVAVSVYHAEKA